MVRDLLNNLGNFMGRARVQPYVYRPGVVSGIGIGVEGLGLTRPQSLPLDMVYDARRTVKGDLGPIAGGHMVTTSYVTDVSLAGNGAAVTGAMALQSLAQFQAGKQ